MNCDKCGVEIAAQSAIQGAWCVYCAEKEEERLGKRLDEHPAAKAAPVPTPAQGEAPWPSHSKPTADPSPAPAEHEHHATKKGHK